MFSLSFLLTHLVGMHSRHLSRVLELQHLQQQLQGRVSWVADALRRGVGCLVLNANEVRVEGLQVEVGKGGANEVVLVEDGAVLDLVIEVHQDGVLHELGLQEALLVNGTVEYALERQAPEEVADVVLGEEVLLEVACEVSHLVAPQVHGLLGHVPLDTVLDGAMEQVQLRVVSIYHLVQNPRIFFSETTVLKLCVCYGLTLYVIFSFLSPIQSVGMLDHDVEPDAWLHLLKHMGESARCYALDGCLCLRERKEEVDNALRDTNLLALLMDIRIRWVEVHDLDVCKLILSWFLALGPLGRIDHKH